MENNIQLSISKLLVENKYRLDTGKDNTAVMVVDIPKVSEILADKLNFDEHFKNWCKETRRSGGVLVGSSIKEFINYLKQKINYE